MIRSQLSQLLRHGDRACLGLSTPIRHFSVSYAAASEGQSPPSGMLPTPLPRRHTADVLTPAAFKPELGCFFPSIANCTRWTAQTGPKQRPAAPPRKPRPSNRPPGPGAQNKGRPAKVIDARSLAAPRASGEPPKIIRNPRLRNRTSNQPQGRKPKPGAAKASQKGRRQNRTRRSENEVDDDEAAQAAAIKQIELEQVVKARPVPVRYEPRDIDFSTLQKTWPSLPTDANARSAAILEKLSSLSGRFANGYIPPHELGRRLWKGQSVLFESEAEKAEALEEVKRLAQAQADKMSQRKGEPVEPRDVKFKAVSADDTKTLLETIAQGKYPALEADKDQPAVMGDVLRNLRNNATYQTAGKRPQFLAKVESLLASSRVKRT
ncbi:uncharacterized protein N7482_005319 [Penicillium canariense]|uniref:Uncharacterized protein n=1 Tax=Penicillium canariense TaxID=189055 RepID=A0A9W9LNB9_9EURO|nr:uncharacterized protein N7482_005319 [Penicillium canariense]KAJ5166538.1 hypothetical protein N7482_005319 [Penicillium canariense]